MKDAAEEGLKVALLGPANSVHVQRWANYFNDIGWEVHVLSYTFPGENKLRPDVSFHHLFHLRYAENFIEPVNRRVRVREIKKILGEIKPDILHAHDLAKYGEYAYLSGFRPYILTNWGLMSLTHVTNYMHFFTKKLGKRRYELRKKAFEEAAAITVLVNHAKKLISKRFNIPEEKIHAFPWGVDLSIFNTERKAEAEALRETLDIPEDARVVLSPRNMSPFYNIDKILAGFAHAIDTTGRQDLYLVLLRAGGEEKYEKKLKKLASKLGVREKTRFVSDFIPHKQMAVYYNMADVAVMIPEKDQGPLSMYEAMACGCVVIATDIPGNREMVKHGKTGFLVDPQDIHSISEYIIRSVEDEEFRENAIKNNLEWVRENADWKKNSLKMEELYFRVLGEK